MLHRTFLSLSLCSLLACLHKAPETATPKIVTVTNLSQMSATEIQALSDRNQEIYCKRYSTSQVCSTEMQEWLERKNMAAFYLHQPPSSEDLGILNQFAILVLDISTLSLEGAQTLSQYKGDALSLNAVKKLEAETAKVLGQFQGEMLSLDGLSTLDADVIQGLNQFQGDVLVLNGLSTLDVDSAQALSQSQGKRLYLNGLSTLDVDSAQALSQFRGPVLSLDGLSTLDVETAQALSQFQGVYLSLNGLNNLSPEVRAELEKNPNIITRDTNKNTMLK